MRILIAITLLAAALVAGCNSAPPPPAAPPPPPIANAVTGTVALNEPHDVSGAATAEVKIYDVAHKDAILAQATIPNANKFPLSFNLPIDVSKVDPKATYVADATLTDGDRRYLNKRDYPVLTDPKHTAKADIAVSPEATPGEKMEAESRKAFAQISTFKQISGTALNDKSTTAWDAFVSNGKVKVVRQVNDLDEDKGRITLKITYHDDDPWVVIREEAAAGSNKAFATTKVGWDEQGNVVLNSKTGGGEASDAEIKSLHAQAEDAYKIAMAKVPPPKK